MEANLINEPKTSGFTYAHRASLLLPVSLSFIAAAGAVALLPRTAARTVTKERSR